MSSIFRGEYIDMNCSFDSVIRREGNRATEKVRKRETCVIGI